MNFIDQLPKDQTLWTSVGIIISLIALGISAWAARTASLSERTKIPQPTVMRFAHQVVEIRIPKEMESFWGITKISVSRPGRITFAKPSDRQHPAGGTVGFEEASKPKRLLRLSPPVSFQRVIETTAAVRPTLYVTVASKAAKSVSAQFTFRV